MATWHTAWWDRCPGRLDFELTKLESAGYHIESQERSSGLLVVELVAPGVKTGVGDVRLQVAFPDTYPFTAPQVIAPDLNLRHHQHPFGGTLCLIGRSTLFWESRHFLAELLDGQLRKAIAAGSGDIDEVNELDQAEPFASYYTYTPRLEFWFDGAEDGFVPGQAGDAEFRIEGTIPPPDHNAARTVALIDRFTAAGEVVHEATSALRQLFPDRSAMRGRWVMLEGPVRANDPEQIWQAAAAADPEGVATTTVAGTGVQIRAVGFPDEISRTELGVAWVVVVKQHGDVRVDKAARRSGSPARRGDKSRRAPDVFHLGRVVRVGAGDLTARSPLTAGTAARSVLVIGCGAIGSVLVDQLARAGVGGFTLVDRDVLEPGNLARHTATLRTTGLHKAVVMAERVMAVNPHATVTPIDMTIGAPGRDQDGRLFGEVLAEAIGDVDLVIDASAEVGVQEFTAEMARSLGVPWLMLSATEGAAGGTVVLVDPDAEWCFTCFQWHRSEETIPFPVSLDGPRVQPIGCAEPTFVGAGFDLAEVSLHAARTCVARLLRHEPDAYPEDPHGAWVLTMRGADGSRTPPTWAGYTVARHPACQEHREATA